MAGRGALTDVGNSDAAVAALIQLFSSGDSARAEAACKRILSQDAHQPIALLISAEIAVGRGDPARAKAHLRRAVKARSADKAVLMRAVQLLQGLDDPEALETALQALLRLEPKNFTAHVLLGRVSEARGKVPQAVAAYDAACAIVPGHAGPDTARALLQLRHAWGDPLPSPPEKQQRTRLSGRLTMTTLGQNGRFGNQLFQYCFLRIYGEMHDLQVEVPDWVGRWLLDLADPYPGAPLPRRETNVPEIAAALDAKSSPSFANHDLLGYGQCHTRHFRPHQGRFRALLQPGARALDPVTRAHQRLRNRGETVVAVHLRRGDYTGGEFSWPAPAAWYIRWLETIWRELERPILYIASDDPGAAAEFSAFSPVTADALEETIPGAAMYLDFHVLSQADLLAVSNSTFSVAAAMLNESARGFQRPDPIARQLIPFDPWDADTMLSASPKSESLGVRSLERRLI